MSLNPIATIQSLEDQRTQVMVSGDCDALDKMLGAELIYGHSGGTVDTKETMLDLLASGKLSYLSINPQIDTATAIAPDIIAGSGMLRTVALIGSVEKRLYGRYLCVWQKRAAGWVLQALQGTDSGSA